MTILSRIPSFLKIYHPTSCLPQETSPPMKVVAFFFDDESMFTTQLQDLKLCQVLSPHTVFFIDARLLFNPYVRIPQDQLPEK